MPSEEHEKNPIVPLASALQPERRRSSVALAGVMAASMALAGGGARVIEAPESRPLTRHDAERIEKAYLKRERKAAAKAALKKIS